jgi:hypothetical protein
MPGSAATDRVWHSSRRWSTPDGSRPGASIHPLERVADVHERIAAGGVRGRIVLQPGAEAQTQGR